MQQINVNELKAHPRNNEFFDDMSGENWEAFLESVKSSGIIEPIVITGDKYIVSGHQRVRACKELGIDTICAETKPYYLDDNYDAVLKDLIETNIRQRGIGNTNQKKMGLCIKELDRIYGIRDGSAGKVSKNLESNNFTPKTEDELLSSLGLGITRQTIQNYKRLTEMIPELEELVDTGIVTNTTALAMMKNLSPQEQEELISSLDTTKRITQKEMQKYIDEIRSLKDNPPKPADYDSTKRQLEDYKKDYSNLHSQFEDKVKELQDLRKQIENIKKEDTSEQYAKKLQNSVLTFCAKISTFIEQVGGYVWLTDQINEIPELERKGYIKAVHAIKSWADTMEYNINNKVKEIN